jgi:benzylsuccinate CoA-transferase BbsF subunit
MSGKALEGLKCLGLTVAGVGNMVISNLAEHGATAIRIESIHKLDNTRVSAPYKDNVFGIDRSGYFAWVNNDRYSIALDIKHPRKMEVAERLIKWADVVVENFAPGAMERSGLGYEAIKKINPRIIMIACSQQGQTGPHREMPGYGGTLAGLVGFTNLTGWPDRWPVQVGRSYPDFIAPRFGLVALLAALDYRDRTGVGQYIDVSEYEDSIHFLAPVILDYTVNGKIMERMGNRSPYTAPHGCYPCKGEDKWCAISAFTDQEWKGLCDATGNPGWCESDKFGTVLARKKNEDELDRLLGQWTMQHTREEAMSLLQKAGVPAGMVQTGEDIVERDPHLKERHYFWTLDHPEIGPHVYPGPNFKLSKTPGELRTAAPCLGQHNEYVCKEILGMSEEEYADLLVANVFE